MKDLASVWQAHLQGAVLRGVSVNLSGLLPLGISPFNFLGVRGPFL